MTHGTGGTEAEATGPVAADGAGRRAGVGMFGVPVMVVLLVLGLGGLVVFTGGSVIIGYAGFALAALGIPYTLVAVAVGVGGRIRIAPLSPRPADLDRDLVVQHFGLFSQRASLVLAVVLLLLLAAAGLVTFFAPPGASGISELGFGALFAGAAIFTGAVFTIGANVPQLYGRRVIALELHAVATRTGAWKLIVVSWILSPLLWVAYSTVSAILFASALLN